MKKIIIYRLLHFQRPNYVQDSWATQSGCKIERIISKYDLSPTRRSCLVDFKNRPEFEYMIMIDEDIIPNHATSNNIFTTEGDAIYCASTNSQGKRTHWGDGDFQVGFCRLSRRVVESLDISHVFDFPLNQDRSMRIGCECAGFRDTLIGLGFFPIQVGVAGHPVTVVAYPNNAGAEILWP